MNKTSNKNKIAAIRNYVPADKARYQRVLGHYNTFVKATEDNGNVSSTVWEVGPVGIEVDVKGEAKAKATGRKTMIRWFGTRPLVWELIEAIEAWGSYRSTSFDWAAAEAARRDAVVRHREGGRLVAYGKGVSPVSVAENGKVQNLSFCRKQDDDLEWLWQGEPETTLGLLWALDDQVN